MSNLYLADHSQPLAEEPSQEHGLVDDAREDQETTAFPPDQG